MEKFKHILWYSFICIPLSYFVGLAEIILGTRRIVDVVFISKKLVTKNKKIDKEKFKKFMERVCK